MNKIFRPMLAAKAQASDVVFPVIASPKIDGIRCLAMDGVAMSRTMKPLPNLHVQRLFREHQLHLQGLDGEIVVGDPVDPDCYRKTTSAIMSSDGEPDFSFLVFDRWNEPDAPYTTRIQSLFNSSMPNFTKPLPYVHLEHVSDLDAYEAAMLAEGYEGVMTRKLNGPYKQNRSTIRENFLLKIKRFMDTEAEVIGYEEETENQNKATTDERGYTKRSTHKAGKVGKGTVGNLLLRGLPNTPFAGVEFSMGSGLTEADGAQLWEERDSLLGRIVKFRYFPIGIKDKPRFPVFLGFRDPMDICEDHPCKPNEESL